MSEVAALSCFFAGIFLVFFGLSLIKAQDTKRCKTCEYYKKVCSISQGKNYLCGRYSGKY